MQKEQTHSPKVAVLLATYNGAQFIEPQIRSLTENTSPFQLHWLDDHSTDNTRHAVREAAQKYGIDLLDCHQPSHQGIPGAFFQLLECVEADIYMFCDQDDIWQPGKIDATVANLSADVDAPALCFSDPLMFSNAQPEVLRRVSEVIGDAALPRALQESRMFMSIVACGNTTGFTRPLREIFLKHKHIAREYAGIHDLWIYQIAVAAGSVQFLPNAPTTLYRRHDGNFSNVFFSPAGNPLLWAWRFQQRCRSLLSRHAQGFILAASTLPSGPKLERALSVARLVAPLNRRQSPAELVRLLRHRATWPSRSSSLWLAATCLCSDANG